MAYRHDQSSLPGSWRGAPPWAGGTGSGAGPAGAETVAPVGRRGRGMAVTWSPTVANLLILVGLEILAYVGLRYVFRTVHGG